MKILNIMEGTELGGTEQSSLNLMKGMKKLGHKFIVLSLSPPGMLKKELQKNDIPLHSFNISLFNLFKSIFLLKKKINELNPDYIINTGGNIISLFSIGKVFKKKSYLAIHYHHFIDDKLLYRYVRWKLFYYFAMKKFSFITFASDFIRDEALKISPSLTKHSLTVNNPIQDKQIKTDHEKNVSRDFFGIPHDAFVIGNAGWLIKRKRFDVLLKVGYELNKKYKNVIILIAGDGNEKNNLLAQAKKLGISKKIIWLGWLKNLNHFYNSIDYLIFNSEIDAVGLTPIEAIIKGVIPFCSIKNGGLKEILKDEYSYFLLNEHDIPEIVKRINFSISNKDETYNLLLKCRNYILQGSSSDLVSNQINRLILK